LAATIDNYISHLTFDYAHQMKDVNV
jgi:hypothetical protein